MKSRKGDTFDYKCTGTVKRGSIVVANELIGVAASDGERDKMISCFAEGVYELPKATGIINQGVKVYWDVSESNVTVTPSENTLIGLAWDAAASSDPTVMVKIG